MKAMHWTYAELEATPVYVRRYVHDFLCLESEAIRQAQQKAQRDAHA